MIDPQMTQMNADEIRERIESESGSIFLSAFICVICGSILSPSHFTIEIRGDSLHRFC